MHTIFEMLSVLQYTWIACNGTKLAQKFTNWVPSIWHSSALGVAKVAKCQNVKDPRAKIMILRHNILTASPHTNKRYAYGTTGSSRPWPLQCPGFTITLRHTTLSGTPLDGWSARRRDLYLATHNTQKRQTSMPRRDSNHNSRNLEAAVPHLRPRDH
jgi:hypothetical protein